MPHDLYLGVAPVHTDEDTSSFVRQQKQEQFRDLKHALQVMGRVESPSIGSCSSTRGSGGQRRRTLAGYQPLMVSNDHGLISLKCSLLPEHMVLIYLLENNRLLLSSINQMKLEAQVSPQYSMCEFFATIIFTIGELKLNC